MHFFKVDGITYIFIHLDVDRDTIRGIIYPGIIKRPKIAGERSLGELIFSPATLGLLIIPG